MSCSRCARLPIKLAIAAVLVVVAAGMLLPLRGRAASFVIRKGGTYSGKWSSDDASVAVISIETREPVIIENSTLRGRGHLIVSTEPHADITIRNTHGHGLNPNVIGKCAGRFA